ncbi:S-adenosylmethionine decarboxylase [Candidatus Micrarchaeota archaeon]|nr:S-adenosylmethionine decarboxylase [Candidatus Micrarchaeota archaeon]
MKNLAPNIFRQRLLVEGFYGINVDEKTIRQYFEKITSALGLKAYGEPIIFSPAGEGKKENQGFDAFVPLVDSGISVYVWSEARFFSGIIYTCKGFDEKKAVEVTKKFFRMREAESFSF